MSNSNIPTGKELIKMAKDIYGTSNINPEQLDYLISMSKPSSYVLSHHRVHGHPITFNISNFNMQKALGHRPWQIGIMNDQYPDKAIIKSRQLGLNLAPL